MDLAGLVRRPPPRPWEQCKIPWSDPAFSEPMLREHLNESHDAASRRPAIIEQQVTWIHQTFLAGYEGKVLDLACGPGLYTSRLAGLGHKCLGIDYAPAAIEHARAHAGPRERYELADIRTTKVGGGWDVILLLFGEFNAFRPSQARDLVRRAATGLAPGGSLLLEISVPTAIRREGEAPHTWVAREQGLFSERPHLLLQDAAWYPSDSASAIRYTVIDAESGDALEFGETLVAYGGGEVDRLFSSAGLNPSPPPTPPPAWERSEEFEFFRGLKA